MTTSINQKQVDKIQRRIGKQFDIKEKAEKEKRDKDFRQNVLPILLKIKSAILRIEKDNPGCGYCFCVWKDVPYVLQDVTGKVIADKVLDACLDTIIDTHKPVEKHQDRTYYLTKKLVKSKVDLNPGHGDGETSDITDMSHLFFG